MRYEEHQGFGLTKRNVIALADAAEENQANMFRALTKLKSATHLVITLISLWQKLSADQVAILEATFLPLAEDTQELGWEEAVDAAISYLLRTCLSKSSKEQALNLSSDLCMPKDTSRLKKNITVFCDRLAKGGRLSLSTDSATQQAAVMPVELGFHRVAKPHTSDTSDAPKSSPHSEAGHAPHLRACESF
ncbi:hypothetical protein Q9966_013046 [Columba livia]|nr:hypothetical protein Q9966_013046 [Columba livia]